MSKQKRFDSLKFNWYLKTQIPKWDEFTELVDLEYESINATESFSEQIREAIYSELSSLMWEVKYKLEAVKELIEERFSEE